MYVPTEFSAAAKCLPRPLDKLPFALVDNPGSNRDNKIWLIRRAAIRDALVYFITLITLYIMFCFVFRHICIQDNKYNEKKEYRKSKVRYWCYQQLSCLFRVLIFLVITVITY